MNSQPTKRRRHIELPKSEGLLISSGWEGIVLRREMKGTEVALTFLPQEALKVAEALREVAECALEEEAQADELHEEMMKMEREEGQ